MARVLDAVSVRQLLLACGGGGLAVVGLGLGVRQQTLRRHAVTHAAIAQLQAAPAVHRRLAADVVVAGGLIGGYVDPKAGSAVLTIPVRAAHAHAGAPPLLARVEAEAEWVGANRPSTPPAVADPDRRETRWLLRHLEVGREGEEAEVLYSLPPKLPPSPWAPSRAPSRLPYAMRALLPEMSALRESPDAVQLVGVGALMVGMNAMAFVALRRHQRLKISFEELQAKLKLAPDPAVTQLHRRAVGVANAAADAGGGIGRAAPPKLRPTAEEAAVYGSRRPDAVRGFSLLSSDDGARALILEARRGGGGGGAGEWHLMHVSVREPREVQLTLLFGGARLTPEDRLVRLIAAEPSLPLVEPRPQPAPQPKRPPRPDMRSPHPRR